jgi:hypothetical protein
MKRIEILAAIGVSRHFFDKAIIQGNVPYADNYTEQQVKEIKAYFDANPQAKTKTPTTKKLTAEKLGLYSVLGACRECGIAYSWFKWALENNVVPRPTHKHGLRMYYHSHDFPKLKKLCEIVGCKNLRLRNNILPQRKLLVGLVSRGEHLKDGCNLIRFPNRLGSTTIRSGLITICKTLKNSRN